MICQSCFNNISKERIRLGYNICNDCELGIMKKLPLLKKLTLQYTAKRANGYGDLSADKVRKIIVHYLKTGSLSKDDEVDIYSDVRGTVWGVISAVPIAVAMLVTFSFRPLLVLPIAFGVMGYLTRRGDFLSKFFPKNLSNEDIQEYEKLVRERYDNDETKPLWVDKLRDDILSIFRRKKKQ